MSRRSPQEKKALSYARDGRNAYGENDKASRTAIPRRKRWVNRANRHHLQRQLDAATGTVDLEGAEATEQAAAARRPKQWVKQPDLPLGAYLDRGQRRRDRSS